MTEQKIKLDDSILERILDLASMMLMAGGEVKRVEETISILCNAYGAKYADVFTITSSIVVTVRFDDKAPITQTRRISSQTTDMKLLASLNELSRRICARLLTNQEFLNELKKMQSTSTRVAITALVWALISASFTLFFGGNFLDAAFSAGVGVLLCIFKKAASKHIRNNYLLVILCSFFGGILGFLPTLITDNISSFYINIGNIMLLIPGIALTTSIRDMFSGDTISGLLRFAEAILVSLVIAWGFAAFRVDLGSSDIVQTPLIQLLTALVGTFGFGFIFNCRIRSCLLASLGGFLGWGIELLAVGIGTSEFVAFFISTLFITLYSELLARLERTPTTVFLVTGLIPLIPGKSLYSTMCYIMSEEWTLFFRQGLATIMYAIAISAGVVIVTALFNTKRKTS